MHSGTFCTKIGANQQLLCTVFGWLGFMPASRGAMESAAQQGYNIAIVPGGIAEMLKGIIIIFKLIV